MSDPDFRPNPIPPDPNLPPSAGRGCAAVALIVIGLLILVPSGLCSAILGVGGIYEMATNPQTFLNDLSDAGPFALAIFVVAAIGASLVYAGNRIRKGR